MSSEEFKSPTEPDHYPPRAPSVLTPAFIALMWERYQVAPSLPGGLFQSGHYELAKHFPRFRRTDWGEEMERDDDTFTLESEVGE